MEIRKNFTIFLSILVVLVLHFTRGFSHDLIIAPSADNKPKTEISQLWGVGIKAGLNGVGLEIVKGFGDRVNVRLGYSGLTIPYSTTQNFEDYNLEIDAKVFLRGANLLADYYFKKNIFHITGGLILNKTLIDVNVKSLSNFLYGDISVPVEDVGTLTCQLGPGNQLSPYVGIGVGNTLSRKHRLSFSFELGTFYQGSPLIKLSGDGVIGPIAGEKNTTLINQAIAQYTWFPMLNFQLTYRIF